MNAARLRESQEKDLISESESERLLALHKALERLTHEDPLKADLVKLRYLAGLTVEQAAEILGISRATADRYWSYARAWLYHEITRGDEAS